ncbi:MAG: mechanosensitive ion channel protein [Porticoccaceae bacterium]|nr:MAG: mechanosensitive ion channel protein [Porticoccaceae bacterium]
MVFFVGRRLARLAADLVQRAMARRQVDPALEHFAASLLYYGLLVFVGVAALAQVGIQTASLVAVIGAAGLAIGLALQGALANFAAGFLLLVFRPFRIGDYVEVAGTAGTVRKIQVFTTELATPDNRRIIIPNGAITAQTIANYSANDTRRLDLSFGIGYRDDLDRAKAILAELLAADPRILAEPAPLVAVAALGDSSVELAVRPWVKTEDYWAVRFDLTEAVKKRFDAEGITIPYPQREVHLHRAS